MPYQKFYTLPQEKRNSILSAAIRLFSEQPYASVSVSAILLSTGLTRHQFNQYFHDKKDLYVHILETGMACKLALVNDLKNPNMVLKTFDYLKLILQASVQFEIRFPELACIAYKAFIEEIPFPGEVDRLVKQGAVTQINDLLAQGILHDDVAPWVDTDMAAWLFQTVYHNFGHYLTSRLELTHPQTTTTTVDVFSDEAALDLFNNLMELLEAGMSKNPEVRRVYYSKHP